MTKNTKNPKSVAPKATLSEVNDLLASITRADVHAIKAIKDK